MCSPFFFWRCCHILAWRFLVWRCATQLCMVGAFRIHSDILMQFNMQWHARNARHEQTSFPDVRSDSSVIILLHFPQFAFVLSLSVKNSLRPRTCKICCCLQHFSLDFCSVHSLYLRYYLTRANSHDNEKTEHRTRCGEVRVYHRGAGASCLQRRR